MSERVFVLEYDLISPLGIGKQAVLQSLRDNVCAECEVSQFSADEFSYKTAAEIKQPISFLYQYENEQVLRALHYDRKLELIVSIYQYMKKCLHPLFQKIPAARAGVVLGIGADVPDFEKIDDSLGHILSSETNVFKTIVTSLNTQKSKLNTVFNPFDVYAVYLAEKLNLGAFQKSSLTACAASTQAIAQAFNAIQSGNADMVLAGGTDSIINSFAFLSFAKLGVLASSDETDGAACKPFDVNRNGTLAGEAAGLCVLASENICKELNITPKFELLGYGNTLDAYKITAPDPSGKGIQRALENALEMAGISTQEIDYINLHGTGTRNNDAIELEALKVVFGPALKNIPISSTKSRHGHAIAAAGIQEFAILCLCMENDFIPGNLNLHKPIDTENTNLITENLQREIRIGMTVNFAFGGVNTVLITRKI